MKKILLLLVIVFLLAGCTESLNQTSVKNVLEYKVNTLDLIVKRGKILHFDFQLENIIANDINNVDCIIEDAPGFTVESIKCDSIETSGNSCHFDRIEGGEISNMDITFRAPDVDSRQDSEIVVSCSYDFSGQSSLDFRIYDSDAKKGEGKKNFNAVQGPMVVVPEVNLELREIRDGSQVKTNTWTRENKDLTLKVDFKTSGTSGKKSIKKSDFSNFVINLENVHVNERLNECNFTYTGTQLMLPNVDEIEFNKDLNCEITTDEVSFEESWKLGQIIADYSYRYTFKIEKNVEVVK